MNRTMERMFSSILVHDTSQEESGRYKSNFLRPGKLYYFYTDDSDWKDMIKELFKRHKIGQPREIVMCDRNRETVKDTNKQMDIIKKTT